MNRHRLEQARPDLLVMHPGPANLGVEISEEVSVHESIGHYRTGYQRSGGTDGVVILADRRRK